LSVLRILGLFDRPADEKAFGALLKSPAIPGLTESLTDLSPTEWRTILAKLSKTIWQLRRKCLIIVKEPPITFPPRIRLLTPELFAKVFTNERMGIEISHEERETRRDEFVTSALSPCVIRLIIPGSCVWR
jgi:hypothetical protein